MCSLSCRAASKARTTCSRVVRLVATPRPWFPSCGLTTTGTPISHGGPPGVFRVADRPAVRRGNPHGAEHHAGHFLVLRDRLGDGAGPIGLGGLDAALLAAVAEEDQAVVVQPAIGNAPRLDGLDDRPRARAKADFMGEISQPLDFRRRR